ncbi:MAG TPA: hypothetical protein VKC66_30820, partial [Xanthobacteraceae bacterium]|nr:hypothetical protein [Xanthobacteraceae bacterium]
HHGFVSPSPAEHRRWPAVSVPKISREPGRNKPSAQQERERPGNFTVQMEAGTAPIVHLQQRRANAVPSIQQHC